jgi:hypothetical protein
MASLQQFIPAQILDTQRTPADGPASKSNLLIVSKVAPVSIAGHLGLRPDDLLETVDGNPAALVDFDLLRPPRESATYRFFLPSRRESLVVKTTCCPLGANLRADSPTLSRLFREGRTGMEALSQLWEAREWQLLRDAVAPWAVEKKVGIVGWFLGARSEKPEHSPMTLMDGAALYELGDYEQGMDRIHDFHTVERKWTTDFHAIARYYQARELLREDGPEIRYYKAESLDRAAARQQGIELLREARSYCAFDTITRELEKETGEAASPAGEEPAELGRFPLNYDFPRIEAGGRESLLEHKYNMQPEQLLIVCVLGRYRANGPYDSFMRRYHRLAQTMTPWISGLHVITEKSDRDFDDRPHWFVHEDIARAASVPFSILWDANCDVAPAVDATGYPFIMVLSKSAQVLCDGDFDDVQLWNMLAGRSVEGTDS